MKGIKYLLFGLMLILIGGVISPNPHSSLSGFGEIFLFLLGIGFGIAGLLEKE